MIVLGYFENRQQAVNQLFAMGHFYVALYMQEKINKQKYEELT